MRFVGRKPLSAIDSWGVAKVLSLRGGIEAIRQNLRESCHFEREVRKIYLVSPFCRHCVAFCKSTLTAYASRFLNLARKFYYGIICEMPQKPKWALNRKINDFIANLGKSKIFNDSTPLHNFTPPPSPLPQVEGEKLECEALPQPPQTFLQGKKVSKKGLISSDSAQMFYVDFKGQHPLNPQNCASYEFGEISPTENPQNCACISDSHESKKFFADFFSKKVRGHQPKLNNNTSPSLAEGVRGWVKSQNLKDSYKSNKSQEIFRFAQNDKMLDSRESRIDLDEASKDCGLIGEFSQDFGREARLGVCERSKSCESNQGSLEIEVKDKPTFQVSRP